MILMTKKDLKRLKVIEQVAEKSLKQIQAAEILELSVRQIKRLLKRLRHQGPRGLLHRGRAKESNRKHSEAFRNRVLALYEKRYDGFGPTLAHEKLRERHRIKIGRETLRQLLIQNKKWQSKHKADQHLQWRERKECFGEMIQIDGSHHDWLEGRGSKLVLMGFIDDATGEVYGQFHDYEGTMPALDSFYRYAIQYGIPHSVYLDRHSTYYGTERLGLAEELTGRQKSLSEFGRAMKDLGVKLIHAQSPQAKGRIERLFGTFQDRLVKEMRLEGIKTKEEANHFLMKYLPRYNRRFNKLARTKTDLHQKVPRNLDQILSIQTHHFLRRDNTIRHQNQFYQILSPWPGKKPKEVMIEERLDGKFYITHKGHELKYLQIKEPAQQVILKKKPCRAKRLYVPPLSHPYKKRSFNRYLQGLKINLAA